MAQDPATLPTLPGYGYVLSGDGATREAPFRADYLDDEDPEDGTPIPADVWFEKYPCPPLNAGEQAVLGPAYIDRVAIAEETYRNLDNDNDLPVVDVDEAINEHDHSDHRPGTVIETGFGTLGPPRFPRLTYVPPQRAPELDDAHDGEVAVPAGVTGPAATVYTAIADGATSRGELEAATGLGKTRLYEVLTELRNDGHITRESHGRYTLPGHHSGIGVDAGSV